MRNFIVTFIFTLFAVSTLFASPTPTPVQTPQSTSTPVPYVVTGTVSYADTTRPVPGALVLATSSQGHVFTTTDANGFYTLSGFVADESYTVVVSKNASPNSAITSYDAALIARFVIGVISFTPLQIMAADVSGDGSITSYDAGLVAARSMGLPMHGLSGTWKFTPASRVYASITGNITDQNYAAVLMGDVSQNWTPPTPAPSPTPIVLPFPSQTVTPMPFPSITPTPCPPEVCG